MPQRAIQGVALKPPSPQQKPQQKPQQQQQKPKPPLGVLRDDLRIFPCEAAPDGSPAWVIHDLLNNKFFKIGWVEFELLCCWDLGEPQQMIEAVGDATTLDCRPEDIEALGRFLQHNNLLKVRSAQDIESLRKAAQLKQHGFWTALLHNYLFYRVPLIKPVFLLQSLQKYLGHVPWGWISLAVVLLGISGLYLVSRQWDVFTSTLLDSLTLQGLLGYMAALMVAKILHEMGHALIATHMGVKVGHMGVAFVVLFPMLYTDTSESWKLTDSRKRLLIASGGILTELALAAVCTFLWAITPDGGLRNGLFFLATLSWVLTLAINFSPFMRFDGYFILSDYLALPNLHQRSTALAQVWLRKHFLGLQQPWPEALPAKKRQALISFAIVTWVYRLIVFLGIALLVYHFFFKVLGIILMLVELYVFIVRPIKTEVQVWLKAKEVIPMRIRLGWLAALAVLLGIFLFPWRTTVHAHGLLRAQHMQSIYAPFPASVLAVPQGERFAQGEVLFELDSSQTALNLEKAQSLAANMRMQLDRLVGIEGGEEQRARLEAEFQRMMAEKAFSSSELKRLVIRAPFDGQLVDRISDIGPGATVSHTEALATLIDPRAWVVDAYVQEHEIASLQIGQTARVLEKRFPYRTWDAQISAIDHSPAPSYFSHALDSTHGGPLPSLAPPGSQSSAPGKSTPSATPNGASTAASLSMFRVELAVLRDRAGQEGQAVQEASVAPVQILIEARPESFATRFFRSASAVLLRESVF